jgi:hypothetical protein
MTQAFLEPRGSTDPLIYLRSKVVGVHPGGPISRTTDAWVHALVMFDADAGALPPEPDPAPQTYLEVVPITLLSLIGGVYEPAVSITVDRTRDPEQPFNMRIVLGDDPSGDTSSARVPVPLGVPFYLSLRYFGPILESEPAVFSAHINGVKVIERTVAQTSVAPLLPFRIIYLSPNRPDPDELLPEQMVINPKFARMFHTITRLSFISSMGLSVLYGGLTQTGIGVVYGGLTEIGVTVVYDPED